VKRNRADGSVGSPHVRVGHFQTPNKTQRPPNRVAFLFCLLFGNVSSPMWVYDNCSRHCLHSPHPFGLTRRGDRQDVGNVIYAECI
ncbi:hypothetical protein, partial [uncultured Shewanella sp.]|uniref:hypothetical protein n=1 Tax=uncultured Shewanella sp. TaxID=173975 RepID=UPI0026336FE4